MLPISPTTDRSTRRPTAGRAGWLAAVLATGALGLAACGSSDPATTDAAGTAFTGSTLGPGSTTADAQPTRTIAPGTSGTTPSGPGTSTTTTSIPSTTGKATSTTAPTTSTTAKPTTTTTTAPTTTTIPGTDPGTLPQTDEKPTASGEQWDRSVDGLWRAIVDDDPDQALPFFFPLEAYKQVKAISDPAGDYDRRLIAAYREDIHALHAQLGANPGDARFVRVDVPASAAWIKPGVEYNKGAYWRVFDSKLVYDAGGSQRSMLLKSMISWRGQWYVVHLSSIR